MNTRALAFLFAALIAPAAIAHSPSAQFAQAVALYARGDYEAAAVMWRDVADANSADAVTRAHSVIGFASAAQQLGLYEEGLRRLSAAKPLIESSGRTGLEIQYEQVAGNLLLASHRHAEAIRALETAATHAANHPRLLAAVSNDLGNALRVDGRYSDALNAHRRSMRLAQEHSLDLLLANASINALRLQLRMQTLEDAAATFSSLSEALDRADASAEHAFALISASELETSLVQRGVAAPTSRRDAWLARAEQFATATNNARLLSLAHGYRASDLAARDESDLAVQRFERALLFASQIRAGDLTYRWHWRLAQLRLRAARTQDALDHYAASLAALAPLRTELMNGYHDTDEFFETDIRPLYVEYVDALLRTAGGVDATQRESILIRARATLEQLKSAELEDYFRDECVLAQEAQARAIDQIDPEAAVLYPIVLPDRIELLVQLQGRLIQHTVAIDREHVAENALQLRELIQTPDTLRFLPYARRLHRWLIEPIKPALVEARVKTLVIVPDDALRVIPFAVLHDGAKYLLSDFAIATTPSLTLTAPKSLAPGKHTVLLTGVSEAVQGFASLPQVAGELASIRAQVGGEVLMDESYTAAGFAAALERKPYAIVHMATHSVVSDSSANSFLLTYDGRLTMSDLERVLRRGRFREHPVELLTLSACETAVGDKRAALGLAGMALKAGARSALATLWRVEDASAAALTSAFYAELASHSTPSKAQALRTAQLRLLERDATAHPAHWAAFMLIGNWL